MSGKPHPILDRVVRTFGVAAVLIGAAMTYGALQQRTVANELAVIGVARRLDAAEERERANRDLLSRMAESVEWMKKQMERNQR